MLMKLGVVHGPMLNRLYQEAYCANPQAADAVGEEWWEGDLSDFAVGWAWWNLTAGLVSPNDHSE